MATSLLPGKVKELKSDDSLLLDSQQAKYPTEFLNTLNISGLPPHKLNLKIGLPIILLRNINAYQGLYSKVI